MAWAQGSGVEGLLYRRLYTHSSVTCVHLRKSSRRQGFVGASLFITHPIGVTGKLGLQLHFCYRISQRLVLCSLFISHPGRLTCSVLLARGSVLARGSCAGAPTGGPIGGDAAPEGLPCELLSLPTRRLSFMVSCVLMSKCDAPS